LFDTFIRLSVEEAEQELRIAAFKREQQRLELEKIKATERMTEQMVFNSIEV